MGSDEIGAVHEMQRAQSMGYGQDDGRYCAGNVVHIFDGPTVNLCRCGKVRGFYSDAGHSKSDPKNCPACAEVHKAALL